MAAHRLQHSRYARALVATVCALCLAGGAVLRAQQVPEGIDGTLVADVQIEGNRTIPDGRIIPHILTRVDRPFQRSMVEQDVRRLSATRMFLNVKVRYRRTPDGRVVVIYQLFERPTIEYVKYRGNVKVKEKAIAKQVELKRGDPMDPYAIDAAREKIEQFLHERGYAQAQVTVAEGANAGDHGAVFVMYEGPKQRIRSITFEGNTVATDVRLRTQIQSKKPILGLFKGFPDLETIEGDIERLEDYYSSLGYFQRKISRELRFNDDYSRLDVTFYIDEGPRYRIRNVTFTGITKFPEDEIKAPVELVPGEYFDQTQMNAAVTAVQDYYGSRGYIFADIKADPRFLEEEGLLDLNFNIEEGARYRIGEVRVRIEGDNPHTRRMTVLNMISLNPGDIADIRELRASVARLKRSGLFLNNPAQGGEPRISFVLPDEADAKSLLAHGGGGSFRGQSPDPLASIRPRVTQRPITPEGDQTIDVILDMPAIRKSPRGASSLLPMRSVVERILPWRKASEPRERDETDRAPDNERGQGKPVIRGQSPYPGVGPLRSASPNPGTAAWPGYTAVAQYPPPGSPPPGPAIPSYTQPPVTTVAPPYGTAPPAYTPPQATTGVPTYPQVAPPPGTAQAPAYGYATPGEMFPGGAALAVPPGGYVPPPVPAAPGVYGAPGGYAAPAELFPGGGYIQPFQDEPTEEIILETVVQETQTGRFMFGVGVNSDAGLVGNIILDEQNFDWRRPPTRFRDIIGGNAFRGGGQQFRIEAIPGTEVQRYLFNFREPYLFDTNVSFGISGYYYDRRFRDWDEQRLGGRFSFGYQFTPDLSGTVSIRAENVNVHDPRIPTPAQLADVVGDTDLYVLRAAIAHDTRDSAFLATEGHLLQFSYEQGFGEYDFPRGGVEASQYFLIRQRPDGSGRHVLRVTGELGITGNQTPIFERYFAGGYTTIRGFDFRGATPRVMNVGVGGEFLLLGSLEYMFPLTADDMLRAVVFTDVGTVEESVKLEADDFRIAPGFGLRISVPALGPAPIALDLAFPVAHEAGDNIENFSFFVGFGR